MAREINETWIGPPDQQNWAGQCAGVAAAAGQGLPSMSVASVLLWLQPYIIDVGTGFSRGTPITR